MENCGIESTELSRPSSQPAARPIRSDGAPSTTTDEAEAGQGEQRDRHGSPQSQHVRLPALPEVRRRPQVRVREAPWRHPV